MRKETVDIDILITTYRSRNNDRKIMEPIRMWASLPMKMRKWNMFRHFRYIAKIAGTNIPSKL